MKNFKLIFGIISAVLVIFILMFLFEFRKFNILQKEIAEKKKIKLEFEDMQKELVLIHKETGEIDSKKNEIENVIPENEQEPLSLIKEIFLLANEWQVKRMEIVSEAGKDDEGAGSAFAAQNSNTAGGCPDGFSLDEQIPGTIPEISLEVKEKFLQLSFECEFGKLVNFLREIFKLTRLVTIDNIRIERLEEILPRQKVTLTVVAYTFIK